MRRLLLTIVLLAMPLGLCAQERPRSSAADFWFDPTQLPSFTGTVERYLIDPRGETNALLFREGPQIVFPPEFGDMVRKAVPAGRPIIVWGIRARKAPVITMLAFAPDSEASPVMVERFYWRLPGSTANDQAQHLSVQGTVKVPYFQPQGDVAGVILEDGTVVTLPPGVAQKLGDLVRPGARIAAEGRGVESDAGRALAAERIGENAESLQPLPAPERPRR